VFPALNKTVRRFPVRAVVITVALSFILFPVAVMLVTYTGIVLSDFLRKRRDYRFPHCPLEPVQVGDNTLKIFNYGHHTFRDMLDAIDNAQESIFLETYILKSDVIGQRFKRHITRKAKEGVKVYIGFDGYGSLLMPLGFRQWPKEVSVSVFGCWRPSATTGKFW
jgi:cardiolipin synthase A/B